MSRSGPHLQRRSITRFQTTRTLYAPAGCSFPQLRTQEREGWFWLALEAPRNLNLGQHLTEVSSLKIGSSDTLEDNIVKEMTESIEIVSSEGMSLLLVLGSMLCAHSRHQQETFYTGHLSLAGSVIKGDTVRAAIGEAPESPSTLAGHYLFTITYSQSPLHSRPNGTRSMDLDFGNGGLEDCQQ